MSYNIKVLYKIKKRKRGNFMKKKGLAISAVAVSLAAAAVFAGGDCQTVRAADVADETSIDLEIDGKYEEKQISKADADVINKAFGYDSGTNNVIVCGDGSVGYIDWEKSSIPYSKVYMTELILPDLTRDAEGNLVIKTDADGNVVDKAEGSMGTKKYAGQYSISNNGEHMIAYIDGGGFDLDNPYKDGFDTDYNINKNMAVKTYKYRESFTSVIDKEVSDMYILRIRYTTDNKLNYYATEWHLAEDIPVKDENGNEFVFENMEQVEEYNKDRAFGYTDFWILPEGVSTVLNYANGIQKDGDAWYYYKDGVVDTSYTGLAKYNGSWWYVKNGKIDFSATTLCKYNGTWWYVKNGKVDFGSTTLCKYNGSWWYVSGGKVNFGATGLCKYNGTWWYVKNGKVSFTTTLCKYNGIWWYINNGAVNFNKTTLVKYGSNWYAVAKGQVAWKFTGKLAYNGRYFNVVNGVVKF